MTGILNLKKNDILDLRKAEPGLKHVVLAAGWDVAKKGFFKLGADYDLDLIAILLNENDKLINRKVYAVIPPKVEYSLSEMGEKMLPLLEEMYEYGIDYLRSSDNT